jgi:hypothetical protein
MQASLILTQGDSVHFRCGACTDSSLRTDALPSAKFKGHDSEKPFAFLNTKKNFDANDRYYVSKLLNVFMARELGALAGSSVIVR